MEPLILKKDTVRYYLTVLGMFGIFGAFGGFILSKSFLFWPLMGIMAVFIIICLLLKDGRYYEFYTDKVMIVSNIPLRGIYDIHTIEYSDIEKISRSLKGKGSNGEGIKLDLKSKESVILYTGFMPKDKVNQAVEILKEATNKAA
jgi:hypothetical protein